MFSGIIKEVGIVKSIKSSFEKKIIDIKANLIKTNLDIGDSLAINGVCHTIIAKENHLIVESIKKTFETTNIGLLKCRDKVNLEPAMKLKDYISGHLISGHAEGMAKIIDVNKNKEYSIMTLSIPRELNRYILKKGSIALDGISLTISDCFQDKIQVAIIPHTLENTTLIEKKVGSYLNIETDLMAKYASRSKDIKITKSMLSQNGFI